MAQAARLVNQVSKTGSYPIEFLEPSIHSLFVFDPEGRLLLQRSIVTHGCFIRSDDPKQQVVEVLRRFDLAGDIRPLTRCIRCNGTLLVVDKAHVYHRLEPKTQRYYEDFRMCGNCRQVYWKGSHWESMRQQIEAICPDAYLDARAPLESAVRTQAGPR